MNPWNSQERYLWLRSFPSPRKTIFLYKIMVCLNIEWSSIPRESSTIFRESNCVQDWPQKIMEPESSLIFQASNRNSRVDDHGFVDLSQVCTDFRYSPAENYHGIESNSNLRYWACNCFSRTTSASGAELKVNSWRWIQRFITSLYRLQIQSHWKLSWHRK